MIMGGLEVHLRVAHVPGQHLFYVAGQDLHLLLESHVGSSIRTLSGVLRNKKDDWTVTYIFLHSELSNRYKMQGRSQPLLVNSASR